MLALLPADPATDRLLGALADTSTVWIAGAGPRCAKTAAAAVKALARIGSVTALAELARLSRQVTHPLVRKRIDPVLSAALRS
ncbi:hypothetical protein [Catellatospora tritici]|uniref:hypothetical protein n=1 Tax=Catellatospora tritici TaxID=2851566 RepID=UPI001C2D92CB|nr:hypothetical protein [Catellatospora tritici]MBV1852847.1 hypothetical protein [Catellatospora tritici]